MKEYAVVTDFVHAGLGSLSVDDAQRLFAKWCVMVDGPSDNGRNKVQSASDENPATFILQFKAIVTSEANIGEATQSTLGKRLSLALVHLEMVAGCLKKYRDGEMRLRDLSRTTRSKRRAHRICLVLKEYNQGARFVGR